MGVAVMGKAGFLLFSGDKQQSVVLLDIH